MKEAKHEGKERAPTQPPTELGQLLGKIGAAARVLNGAAGDATRRIEAVEQSLLDAEPGVSVWSATLLSEKATYQRDDGSPSEPALRVVTLGFARVKKDKWGICVRDELKLKKGVPHLEQLVRDVLGVLEQQITVLDSTREAAASSPASAPNHSEPQPAAGAPA
jgi:hypothetical protein